MELPRRSERLRGDSPALGWLCFEKLVGDHLEGMSRDDMDFEKMREVYKLARLRQGPKIRQLVVEYNETHFRELIQTLGEQACHLMMNPDVADKLFKAPSRRRGSARRSRIKSLLTRFKTS